MKQSRFLPIVAIFAIFLLAIGCGGGPTVEDEVPPTDPVVTEEPTEEPVEPPPPPPPVLSQSQFATAYFDFDKYNLRGDARTALDQNYDLLNEFSDAIIKIEGHCDDRGTIEYNLSLGEKRARSTMDYLTGLGIAADRISIISYGKERPAETGSNEAAWSKNRRCEFRIVSQ